MLSSPIDRDEGTRAAKRALRAHYRAVRSAITPEDKEIWDRALCEAIASLPCFSSAKTLLTYYPFGDEPNLLPVVQQALEKGITVAFPVCEPDTCTMVFRAVRSLDDLARGAYGICEPTDDSPVISDFGSALCLVPALCFDTHGFRIGYGKGYYDRFLASHPVDTVGATYHVLLASTLPCEPTDRSVSILITERGILLPNEEYGK